MRLKRGPENRLKKSKIEHREEIEKRTDEYKQNVFEKEIMKRIEEVFDYGSWTLMSTWPRLWRPHV